MKEGWQTGRKNHSDVKDVKKREKRKRGRKGCKKGQGKGRRENLLCQCNIE